MFYVSSATIVYFDAVSVENFVNLCSLLKCLSNKFRNTRPMFVDTLLLYGGLYQMVLRFRF